MSELSSLCVYCGSSPGANPTFLETATALGRHLGESGIRLVYGGGNIGLMGAVADGALAAGGEVIGVIPKALAEKEVAHCGLTEMHTVGSMHERKTLMADLSDAFLAMPGGIGTMEEIFEVFTWTQLGFHAKPCAFLNVAGYYDELFSFLKNMVESQFLRPEHFDLLITGDDFRNVIAQLAAAEIEGADKWLDHKAET